MNSVTESSQKYPSVSVGSGGEFVVVWKSVHDGSGIDTSGYSIQGQRFGSDGSLLGGEFLVNGYTTGQQAQPQVGMASDGSFVVVWHSYGSDVTDTDNWSVQGRRFGASGSPIGAQFQVNTYTTLAQRIAALSMEANGDFVVAWRSLGSAGTDDSQYSIQGQPFLSTGAPIGAEFQVNTYTTDTQDDPSVAMTSGGNFVVVWHSSGASGGDTSFGGIFGHLYRSSIFADGFESADTMAWSSTRP